MYKDQRSGKRKNYRPVCAGDQQTNSNLIPVTYADGTLFICIVTYMQHYSYLCVSTSKTTENGNKG